jgi:hypothetical protein
MSETSTSYGHSADYLYLDQALRLQWRSFSALEAEITSFVPRSRDDYTREETEMSAWVLSMNPGKSHAEISQYVKSQFDATTLPRMQLYEKFDSRHMAELAIVVVLSHALCEAIINAVLAIGLYKVGNAELFTILEKADLRQKWICAPKAILPSYSFPIDRAIHETLITLIRQRNALVHYKIRLEVDGKRVLDGSPFERHDYCSELRWIRRFYSLPYDLSEFIARCSVHGPIPFLRDRGSIERVPAHSQM